MEISLKAGASLSSARLQSFCYDSAAAGEDDGQRDDSRKGLYKRRRGETSYSESFSIQVYNTIVWLRILLLYKTLLDDSADS